MALQLTHTLVSDITLTDAYHKITWWCGGVAGSPIDVQVSTYKDAAARTTGKPPAIERRFNVSLDVAATGNILQNLYASIKTLPEFSGSTDV